MVLMRDPVEQEMAMAPEAADPKSIAGPIKRQLDLRLIRYARDERMVNLWKAGAFDDLFGPCTAKGVIMKPSPKEYVEARPCRRQGDSGVPSSQGLRPAAPDRPPE